MSRRPRKRGYPRHERTVGEVRVDGGSVLHVLDEDNPAHTALRQRWERQAAAPAYWVDRLRSVPRLDLMTARGRHQERRRLRREEQRSTNT
ncbi:MAG TPA: hypothetical protein VKC57_14760, partial [Ktedonobacterales bacterium]|nr:hypothetical protein [Ktedonobacterales bacterium]